MRYPDYLWYLIQQLKMFRSLPGRFKITDILARAGLHISASTIRRIINEPLVPPATLEPDLPDDDKTCVLKSDSLNHIWGIDLTLASIDHGFLAADNERRIHTTYHCFTLTK
jgi:hypothetical protein